MRSQLTNPLFLIKVMMNNLKVLFLLLSFALLTPAHSETIQGQVAYAVIYKLNFGVSGEVKMVGVEEDDSVSKDSLLVELENSHLISRVAAEQAVYEYQKAEMEETQRAYDRNNELYEEGSLSKVELQKGNVAFLKSSAQFHQSEASLLAARNQLKQSKIFAPTSGVVLRRLVNPGERIVIESRHRPAIVFASHQTLIRAELDPAIHVFPALGDKVSIATKAGTVQGQITAITPRKAHKSKQKRINITIQTEAELPSAGQVVEINYGED